MKDCHKCPESKKIAAGAYAKIPWEKTPCAKCLASRRAPACRTCPTQKKINQGELIGISFHDTPCANCKHFYEHDPLSNHGRIHVEFDPNRHDTAVLPTDPELESDHPIFEPQDPKAPHRNHLKPSIAAMSYLMKAMVSLPSLTREVVLDRLAYPERPMVETAARLGVARSTVHDHLKRARANWPALAWAIPMKSWTQKKKEKK